MTVSRRTLIERIDRFIASLEKGRREPDEWEAQCLQQALADIADGDLGHAEEMMLLARTAPELRTAGAPPGLSAGFARRAVGELRAQLQRVRLDLAA